jgi:hypothetical protein
MAATTAGKREVYAPKYARQSRALSLGLFCLLLAWPRHARLCRRPTVTMPWIHLGFTSCWSALRKLARVGAGRCRGRGDASDSAGAHRALVGSLQVLCVGAAWSELKLVARWIRRTAAALAGVPGALEQDRRQKNGNKSNWVMRPSGATPANVSTARHRRVGDDTVLPESCSGFATGDGAAMGCSCRKWVPRTEQRVIAFTTKNVSNELGLDRPDNG